MDTFQIAVILICVFLTMLVIGTEAFASVCSDTRLQNDVNVYTCSGDTLAPTAVFAQTNRSVAPTFAIDEGINCLSENGIFCFAPYETCEKNKAYIQNNVNGIQSNLRPIRISTNFTPSGFTDVSFRTHPPDSHITSARETI